MVAVLNRGLQENHHFDGDMSQYLTVRIDGQLFGIPVAHVRDVFNAQNATPIPLAPKEIVGTINLRGRIATAIDMRTRLNLPPLEGLKPKYVAVDHKDELYSLVVDSVDEVIVLSNEKFEKNPTTLDVKWQKVSAGIYKLNELLIILNINEVMNLKNG